jgi:hypothetical protein
MRLMGQCAGIVLVVLAVAVGVAGASDSYMDSANPDTNYGSATTMVWGNAKNQTLRPIIDTGSFPVPYLATIDHCYLYLVGSGITTGWSDGHLALVSDAKYSGWTETGVTWNKYNGTNSWSTAGGDWNTSTPTPTGNLTCDSTGGRYFEITDLCRWALNNRAKALSMIGYRDGTDVASCTFYTEEATPSSRPQVVATYRTATPTPTPISTPQASVVATADTDIATKSGVPYATPNGTSNYVRVGYTNSATGRFRGLLLFDLGASGMNIPSNATVDMCDLSVTRDTSHSVDGDIPLYVYRVTNTGWNETDTTWEKKTSSENWNTPGLGDADRDPNPVASSWQPKYDPQVNVLSACRDAVANHAGALNLELAATQELCCWGGTDIYSRNWSTASQRPMIKAAWRTAPPTVTNTPTRTNTVPANTPTQTATNTVPTNTPTQTAANTVPTNTATPPPTFTETATVTNTPTVTNTVPTDTPTKTNTVPTQTPTNTVPTNTPTPTITPVPAGSCCNLGADQNCVDPELYGTPGRPECPLGATVCLGCACVEVPAP